MIKKTFKLTREGINELKSELHDLKAQRVGVAEQLKTAREFGDLSENAEYDAARAEQRRVELRIKEIENILQNVKVITEPNQNDKVGIGSKVDLEECSGGNSIKTFHIVGSVEADPMENKISDESPIGKALMGKKKGEEVSITTPGGAETLYTIKKIS
ncbi:transcription elongation factor GreA [Candidatus Saccharibacteria bacterium CPR2]|nr:transcription elongation factor GreA [Candidatus Saccharibacteria bacterium CPR2]